MIIVFEGLDGSGKETQTKLIEKMTKIANLLLKWKIDIRRLLFRQILNNFGGK